MTSLSEQLEIMEQLLRIARTARRRSAPAQPQRRTPKRWWRLLPEDTTYKDTGCQLHPSCLDCPLPRCVEDEPRSKQRLRQGATAATVNKLLAEGYTQVHIARRLGVSPRTIRRYKNAQNRRRT